MRRGCIPIPSLDPPWPDSLRIAVVTSRGAPADWRRLAHDAAAVAQPGGHSFPLGPQSPGHGGADDYKTALLYRHASEICGYLCLASRLVTGHRSLSEGYRQATDAERVVRPCVMVVWVDAKLRRRGMAQELVEAAAGHADLTPSGLAWAEPFTDSGYLLAQSLVADGLWIADYS
jgi:hypothetical protein